jgi:hypothetical protein
MIIAGARHFDEIMHGQIMARNDQDSWRLSEQGFIDQKGVFLSREDAWVIANDGGQIIHDCISKKNKLFSEDLY